MKKLLSIATVALGLSVCAISPAQAHYYSRGGSHYHHYHNGRAVVWVYPERSFTNKYIVIDGRHYYRHYHRDGHVYYHYSPRGHHYHGYHRHGYGHRHHR